MVPASQRSLLDEGKTVETSWVKRIEWDRARVKHWLRKGAQPTKRVAWLLHKVGERVQLEALVRMLILSFTRAAGESEYVQTIF